MKKNVSNIIVAIDIGTTKICVLVAQYKGNQLLDIIGIGKNPSDGLARGVVVDIAPAVQSIKQAVREAELMAGISIDSAYIGISGSHISALNSLGMVTLKGRDIRPYDIAQAITSAKTVAIPEGQQILHAIPQYYTIDGNHRVRDPLGMHAMRLEASVHIILGGVNSVQNLVRCSELAGIEVRDIILEPLASAHAVLTHDEQDLGVGLLDIGGGTSDFAIYQHGSIRHTHIFPIAGNLFTYDIAQCLQITRHEAERIKKEHGCALTLAAPHGYIDAISLDGTSVKAVNLQDLAFVLEARTQELFNLLATEIQEHQLLPFMPSGLVLTGGGSLLLGMPECGQLLLHTPLRVGKPQVSAYFKESLEHPMYATSYGLLLHAIKDLGAVDYQYSFEGPMTKRIFSRMKSWVGNFF